MTPNVTRIYFELSHAEKEYKSLANRLHSDVVSYRPARAHAAPHDWSELSCYTHQPEKQFSLKNTLATLCLVKGYINSSFTKDKTISIQSKQIHL